MQAITERPSDLAFVVTTAEGRRSWEDGVVASGQGRLSARTILKMASGKLVAWDGTGIPIGILAKGVDATSADKPAAYLARDAEVNGKTLIYPAGHDDAAVTGLYQRNIVVRDGGSVLRAPYGLSDLSAGGGGSSGLVLISSGTITVPEEYVDIALPSGYALTIDVDGLLIPGGSSLAGSWSFDGGTTFIGGPQASPYETGAYQWNNNTFGFFASNVEVSLLLRLSDYMGCFYGQIRLKLGGDLGTAGPGASFLGTVETSADSMWQACGSQLDAPIYNADFAPARPTHFRLQPYGNGDCDPPTSGATINAGSWTLLGTPTP
jgi:hypothetical protein